MYLNKNTTYGRIWSWFSGLCQYNLTVPPKKSTTYGRILGQFYADDEIQPVFLRPDTFLYTAENGELIQPQVVLRR